MKKYNIQFDDFEVIPFHLPYEDESYTLNSIIFHMSFAREYQKCKIFVDVFKREFDDWIKVDSYQIDKTEYLQKLIKNKWNGFADTELQEKYQVAYSEFDRRNKSI